MKQKKKGLTKMNLRRWVPIYILGLPAIIYLFINNYMPLYGLTIAFKDYKYNLGISGSEWCGFKNFEYLFATKDAWTITRNTLLYNFVFIILNMVLGVTVAIFLNEIRKKSTKKVYQTLILLPYLMSMVVVSYLAYAFLGDQTGIINSMLKTIGLRPIRFYATKAYWPFILTFVNEWRVIGYSSIIYLATLVGLGSDCYEAAMVDGATKWQQIRYITLPQLKPTVIMMTTLAMGTIFRSDFGLFYQIPRNQGMLYPVTDTIDTYVFRALLQNSNIGLSSAAAFYQSVVCFITIIVFNAIVNKISKEDALF